MMPAVSGSSGSAGGADFLEAGDGAGLELELDGEELDGEEGEEGLKEMMYPASVGTMSVGRAQCRRTSQKAGVWKTDRGG